MSTLKVLSESSISGILASAYGSQNDMRKPIPCGPSAAGREILDSASPAGVASGDCLLVHIEDNERVRTLSCLILTDLGMYVRADERITDDTVLRMRFTLPRSVETIEVTGEVTSVSLCAAAFGSEAGFGILFRDLSEDDRRRIRNYIEWKQIRECAWEPDPEQFTVMDPWVSAFDPKDGGSAGLRAESFLMRFPVTPEMEEALRVAGCC
jgi:hypothetical protein